MEALKIYTQPHEIDFRLNRLGLTRVILDVAMKRGHLARLECTANHPVTSAGFYAWSETVRALRELLIPEGWEISNEANQGLVVHQQRGIKLAVSGGDEFTGIKDNIPTTRSSKGPKMSAAVFLNGWLFPEMDPYSDDSSRRAVSQDLWILLVHWNIQRHRLQSELSKPIEMGDNDRPTVWGERIILPHFDGDVSLVGASRDGGPKSPEIVVEIKRRA
jgi:hypothetical protein